MVLFELRFEIARAKMGKSPSFKICGGKVHDSGVTREGFCRMSLRGSAYSAEAPGYVQGRYSRRVLEEADAGEVDRNARETRRARALNQIMNVCKNDLQDYSHVEMSY